AGVHRGQVHARDGRTHRMRAGGDEQAVVVLEVTVVEQHLALGGVERDRATAQLTDAQALEVVDALAQIGARLVDVAFEQVGNRHARIRRRVFKADHQDVVGGRDLAQGFGSNDARGAVAENQVFHWNVLKRSAAWNMAAASRSQVVRVPGSLGG